MAARLAGDLTQADRWQDQAVAWMKKNRPADDVLKALHEEATVLRIGAGLAGCFIPL